MAYLGTTKSGGAYTLEFRAKKEHDGGVVMILSFMAQGSHTGREAVTFTSRPGTKAVFVHSDIGCDPDQYKRMVVRLTLPADLEGEISLEGDVADNSRSPAKVAGGSSRFDVNI